MTLHAEIIKPSDPAWADFLDDVPHDFYHLPEYTSLSAPYEGGEAVALVVSGPNDERLLLPLVMRPLADGLQDAASPYGYPGPLVRGPQGFMVEALEAGVRALADAGTVSLFVRLHPILNRADDGPASMVVPHGETVVIDLSLPEEEQWRQMKKAHRQQIRRAERDGVNGIVDSELSHLRQFADLYRATMERRHARDFYFFDDEYFEGLASALGSHMRLFLLEQGGAIIAGGIFVETDGIVQSHLSADDPERTRGGVKKLLYDHVRRWAMARGDRWFHLGGGVGASEDSLFHFKAGFSPQRVSFRTLRVVTREADYQRLVAAAGSEPADEGRAEYFPAYRRPDDT